MPEPVLVSIAAALAGKAATSLYDLVRSKLRQRPDAEATLEAAQGAAPDSPEVHALAEELAHAEQADPAFHTELRALWQSVSVQQQASDGGVVNQITGQVSGKVVQARDVEGGISL